MICKYCFSVLKQRYYCHKCGHRGQVYTPDEAEIALAAAEIRASWTEAETRKRAGVVPDANPIPTFHTSPGWRP